MDLVEWCLPIFIVITEIRLSGARADEIIETLPFNGATVTNTIGFVGGIWLLWCILWNNLRMLATMHDLPWALMGDFNEVLSKEEKSGGNPDLSKKGESNQRVYG